MGKPGFPTCGEPVEPHPCLWGVPAAPTSGWEMGKPGFPIPLPVGTTPSPGGRQVHQIGATGDAGALSVG